MANNNGVVLTPTMIEKEIDAAPNLISNPSVAVHAI